MIEMVLGKCRYCGSEVIYDSGETYTKCSCCGETLVIAEFQNEQIKIQHALAERDQLKKELEAAEKAIKAEQEKTGNAISGIAGLKDYAVCLHNQLEENLKALESFEGKWEQSRLNQLVEQYHQAENLQFGMAFEKAEDEYRKVIIMGGKDPEVYWRIILCHYGIVYQKDNDGQLIPTILRPDLSTGLTIIADLEGSYRGEQDRRYYSTELNRINNLLEKYRRYRTTSRYDVFISVKQKIHFNGKEAFTEDYKIASELFHYLARMGLRVFNSEQPSCRKPAEEWEPYILAALLSSKVMIVVGTSAEYMESQWVQNEWRRFQWLQREEEKKSGKTDRKLLCFIDNMTGYDLPKDLEPLQAIINKAGAYQELDRIIKECFPNLTENFGYVRQDNNLEIIRQRMQNWLAFKQFDLVKEEYMKVIREGTYSLDVRIGLYNICAEHKLSKASMLETVSFDLSQEETIRILLENNKNPNDQEILRELLKKNEKNKDQELPHRVSSNEDASERRTMDEKKYHDKGYTQAVASGCAQDAEQGKVYVMNNPGYIYPNGYGVVPGYAQAVVSYVQGTEQGNIYVQSNPGYIYPNGYGVVPGYAQAVVSCVQGTEQGNMYVQSSPGYMYPNGYGVVPDYAQTVASCVQSAEQGNEVAQNTLGMMYEIGNGMVKDYVQAVTWYRKSAEQGNAYAQINLGRMYQNGYGVAQDYTQAVAWYRKSAEQGNAAGQYNLGWMYQNGYGVAQDYAQAVAWYWKSAGQGDAYSQACLGYMYENGYGVAQDYEQAVAWYRKSAEQGNAYAQKNLGVMYENGNGVAQDYAQAVAWYRKGAEQGDAAAQKYLGWMYQNGCGVEQDYAQAVAWYRKSAEQGNADAQNNLGYMYHSGNGVAQDDAQAVAWFRKSAEQGNAVAQNNLGCMYQSGNGVVQDYAQAVEWYRKSVGQGNADAQNNLGYMYEYGYGVAQDYARAVAWYRKSAKQGNADAQNNLGNMFFYGRGVMKNNAEAIAWYRKSAAQGNSDAKDALKRLNIQ